MLHHPLRAACLATTLALACSAEHKSTLPPSTSTTVPHFDFAPGNDILSGEPLTIALQGLSPASEVEIVAERPVTPPAFTNAPRMLYRARASFRVGADGRLDLARAAPSTGSYDRADPRGILWSMTQTDEPVRDPWPDEQIRLVASQRGVVVARQTLTLRKSDPKVEVTTVGPELPGAVLARLPGSDRRPAVIVLGGSEGGDWFAQQMSPRLASHGYAVLGLPYYVPAYGPPQGALKELPAAFVDIPVDRLDRARDWLRRQPGVDGDRIAIYGVSKGAELALLAASRFPWVTAVVAIVPTDVVWEGWGIPGQTPGSRSSFAWRGEPLPFVPYKDFAAELAQMGTGGVAHLRRPHDNGRAANPEAVLRARIPIERYRGALLVAGGGDDQIWDSGTMAGNISRSRSAAGLPTTALVFSDAGHTLSGDGCSPTAVSAGLPFAIGGTPVGNAHAQADVWRETLAFLSRALAPRHADGPRLQPRSGRDAGTPVNTDGSNRDDVRRRRCDTLVR